MSITERRSLIYARRRATRRLHWQKLADLVGLLVALWFVAMNAPGMDLVLVLGLATSALVIWLGASQLPNGPMVLVRRGHQFLAVPLATGVCGLAISSLTGATFSIQALAIFVVVWTGWMLVVRLVARRLGPYPRLLYIGNPETANDLRKVPGIEVIYSQLPREDFGAWDTVVFDPSTEDDGEWKTWLLHARMAGLQLIPSPLALEAANGRVPIQHLDSRWGRSLFSSPRPNAVWKRGLDLCAVVLLAPFLLLLASVVALIVIVDGGRPVLFWQDRVGKDGNPFRMVKFRTMRQDAEKAGAAFASEGDPRVTRMGAFLRKFRLDELPQFWNVLKGDMSIIGPRPEQRQFVDEFEQHIPFYSMRHKVRPGITGWAQVMNGYAAGEAETREKLSYDLYYIKNFSPLLDLLVVLKTLRIIFTGFGAR